MTKLLQIDFPYSGPFGDQMAEAFKELANSIAEEPGFIWKIWTESENAKEGGGIYLFEDEETAKAYLDKHTTRLKGFGIPEVHAKIFDVNKVLSNITNGPID
ncbi:monooxygenase [Shewanella glacialipiscicola]|uniref:Monooxygenase n=1 Tax=Shewanella glacialipiscicola TaxID=614069 RepID=A0ABQ6J596_9GAMM|nr:monooxygenase [Shewanella glacialipiscicola]MCL1085699.1 monooxygenase [Shewanella glacialipiscicola]MCU7996420.1 monooxygenase [Shewanella glacialipiscicola]MCU8027733.1 monooxygenase [Shewanella glacialipiscicola]GIU11148.1 monooxygenase [Shewanella glacialipiscicola]GMA83250.1 monooxygenase [Shewanella glacialipiscicola]